MASREKYGQGEDEKVAWNQTLKGLEGLWKYWFCQVGIEVA